MKLNIFSVVAATFLACMKVNADLTSAQKETLLSLHREARNSIGAPDMQEIEWDDDLASKAQSYSENCLGMVHSGEGPENLASQTGGNVSVMFNLWMTEKEAFDESGYRAKFLSGSYNGNVVGHYSQIVWASNTKLGCGLSYCEDYKYKYLLVCRYKTGNILNRQVYAEPTKTTTTETATTTYALYSPPTEERCGRNHGSCPPGKCCNRLGYCGTTIYHCMRIRGCQVNYGICRN